MKKIEEIVENSKLQRIQQIYDRILKNPEGVRIMDLAEELQVSTKTIQRDLQTLEKMGVRRVGRSWVVDRDYIGDRLNDDEKMVISVLDELARNAGKIFHAKAKTFLTQVSRQLEHPVFANLKSEIFDEVSIDVFDTLQTAIRQRREIRFKYERKEFWVKPIKLALFDGFWYLLGFDCNKNDTFKKFHLKTIRQIESLKLHFEIDQEIVKRIENADSAWFNLGEFYEVRLWISPVIKKYFMRKPLSGQKFLGEDESDGSIEIAINITHDMEIKPIIYTYLPYIKVISPKRLVKAIKKEILEYAKELEE